jgi:uncharacterized protein YndB with AHSA1/START domain
MTTQGSRTVTIAAAPEAVWPWIAHVDKHGEWSPRPYRVERLSGEANEVGSRYRSIGWVPGDKSHSNEFEITESSPYTRFALRADDPMGPFQNSYDLKPTGDGTEVTYRIAFPPLKGMAAMMVPILFPLVGMKDIRKRMDLQKAKAEGSR